MSEENKPGRLVFLSAAEREKRGVRQQHAVEMGSMQNQSHKLGEINERESDEKLVTALVAARASRDANAIYQRLLTITLEGKDRDSIQAISLIAKFEAQWADIELTRERQANRMGTDQLRDRVAKAMEKLAKAGKLNGIVDIAVDDVVDADLEEGDEVGS